MDKDKKRKQDRAYYLAHRTQILNRVSQYQKDEAGKIRKYQRDYAAKKRREDPDWKEKRDAYFRDYYRRTIAARLIYRAKQKGTLQELCRTAAHHALRNGKLIRPNQCDACGKSCQPQMHHRNYNNPLKVIWLCSLCHGVLHSLNSVSS